MRGIIFTSLFFLCLNLSAQDFKHPSYYSAFAAGQIYQHSEAFKLIPESEFKTVSLIEAGVVIPSSGKYGWERYYRFPNTYIGLVHIDFGSKNILGYADGIYGGVAIKLLHYKDIFELRGMFGSGICWLNKRYDPIDDSLNQVIASHVNNISIIRAIYEFKLSKNLKIFVNSNFGHCSNGAIKRPNRGINTLTLGAGLRYIPTYKNYTFTDQSVKAKLSFKQRFSTSLLYTLGFTEQRELPHVYKVHCLFLNESYRVTPYFLLTVGTGIEYNIFIRELQRSQNLSPTFNSVYRSSIRTGFEMLMGHMGFGFDKGWYMHDPHFIRKSYERLAVNLYSNDIDVKVRHRYFAGIGLKSHNFTAEYLEINAGIVF